ncbi:tyrosyl-DNA phosphodiesterase 1 [Venturia nashicola]|uniref:Tyrosyl-DNA phosphodiesterase 1 n=1 Tax=Venturia nashicola TaxID=86259 RepID=A0A4Z1P470_9PEZI|nr:tyrosyl-DNA phosphodiesterase 1 [Venturia nashicola]
MADQGPGKRRKLNDAAGSQAVRHIPSLDRDISPPASTKRASAPLEDRHDNSIERSRPATRIRQDRKDTTIDEDTESNSGHDENYASKHDAMGRGKVTSKSKQSPVRILPSPIQLTRIQNLPSSHNVDTVSLRDLIGDPMIKECWQFNYLLDLDFIMNNLDPDVKELVHVKIVHGSWKREDAQRSRLEESAKRYPNAQIICAHMPEAFGTHHTKMMVLFRHDDTAQIVIHTANMISQDWTNLTQAVWRSPVLLLLADAPSAWGTSSTSGPIGSGTRFKYDFLRYLRGYGRRTESLVNQIRMYDFSTIKAALISSMPRKDKVAEAQSARQTSWGWPGLKEILSTIPCNDEDNGKQSGIVAQVSSIATLTEKWINNFTEVLSTKRCEALNSFFGANCKKANFQVIFPTAEEVRQSIDGYASGASIHMKIQSAAQQKQLAIMKPMFCHWMGDAMEHQESRTKGRVLGAADNRETIVPKRQALRGPAAPHIKTYIRFATAEKYSIQWAMVTSANLSQQAWGALPDKEGAVRICSYELGVVVWPDLFREDEDEEVRMVPTFGKDTPDLDQDMESNQDCGNDDAKGTQESSEKVVGFRMPYDLPLIPYGRDDLPWCATSSYNAPDAFGRGWGGFEPR